MNLFKILYYGIKTISQESQRYYNTYMWLTKKSSDADQDQQLSSGVLFN